MKGQRTTKKPSVNELRKVESKLNHRSMQLQSASGQLSEQQEAVKSLYNKLLSDNRKLGAQVRVESVKIAKDLVLADTEHRDEAYLVTLSKAIEKYIIGDEIDLIEPSFETNIEEALENENEN